VRREEVVTRANRFALDMAKAVAVGGLIAMLAPFSASIVGA
jgi:hypothetical protein